MSNINPCDVLAERFAAKTKAGLKDVKFYLRAQEGVETADVCEEVNRLYQAKDAGKCEPLVFNDLRWRPAPKG